MSKIVSVPGGVCAAKGFQAAGLWCGIRKNKLKKDLALIYSPVSCAAAAVYTQNKVKGAPIAVTKANISDGYAKAVVCNSGNANTCNADGIEKAQMMCQSVADALDILPADVVVASTGVIGQPLPIEPILQAMPSLAAALSHENGSDAAEAIMTTDVVKKEVAVAFELGGKVCHIGGIAKGSGMIHPNMATMLCFLTSDVAITPSMLQKALSASVADTFNMVSVDGDTSTNDMVSILANGLAENSPIEEEGTDYRLFLEALTGLNTQLSRAIAGDGEGATKLLECTVDSAPDLITAKKVAKSVITSSLFKAAMFGADANWGRVLCAIGYTDAEFEIDKVEVTLASCKGSVLVCRSGSGVPFDENRAKNILLEREIQILISLHQGCEKATAWGCDLTYDYVKINGDYRT